MNKKVLPWIIAFCALGLGGTAAYYSIVGLSKLFAGVSTAVIIMASFLEASKLTLATLLHSYWKKLNIFVKTYFISALIILSVITSAGIYGMLSSGYQATANKGERIDTQIGLLEKNKLNYSNQLALYNAEQTSINQGVNELRKGLSNNVIQYKDKETGQLITTTSSSTRRSLERQLDQSVDRQDRINVKIDSLNSKIFSLNDDITEIKLNNDLDAELGPLKYISRVSGWEMDKVVNYFLLILVLVFDPLAISLVIAANFGFAQVYKNQFYQIYNEEDNNKKKLEMAKKAKKTVKKIEVKDAKEIVEEVASTFVKDEETVEETLPETHEEIYNENFPPEEIESDPIANVMKDNSLSLNTKKRYIRQINNGDEDLKKRYF